MEHTSIKSPTHEYIHPTNNFRKSCSSLNIGYVTNGTVLRESQSFTDGIQDNYKMLIDDKDDDLPCDKDSVKDNAVFYIWTKQVNSFEPYMVYENMLTYQGNKYSQSDIAPVWKKDCRMWLWKTKQARPLKKVDDIFKRKIKKNTFRRFLVSHRHSKETLSHVLVQLNKLRVV